MEIGETTTTTATKPQARTGLSGDFDSFLKLLTTQLQNQDPTSPVLQRDSRAMERSLNDNGVKLDGGGLTFSLKQEHPQQDGRGFNPFGRHQASGHSVGEGPTISDSAETEPAVRRSTGLRLLDVSA